LKFGVALRGDLKKEAVMRIKTTKAALVVVGRSKLQRMNFVNDLNLPVMLV
jgi:hypothetical protein